MTMFGKTGFSQNYDENKTKNLFDSGFMPKHPRCPDQKICISACVTQSCKFYPFMCSYSDCKCTASHKYCKVMRWQSILSMFNNYTTFQTPELREYMKKIEQIYVNIGKRIKRGLELFYEYIQTKLYDQPYQNIKHYLQVEKFDKITSKDLGKIITILTKDKETQRQCDYQVQRVTISEMKDLDQNIDTLLKGAENLYLKKFKVKGDDNNFNINTKSNDRTNNNNSSRIFSHSSRQNPQASNSQLIKQLSLSHLGKQESRINPKFYKTGSTNFTQNALVSERNLKLTKSIVNKPSLSTQEKDTHKKMLQKSSVHLQYPKCIASKIISSASNLNILLNMGKIKEYKLLYRASQHDYSMDQFYRRISLRYNQNKQQSQIITVILVKTQFNKILGGCTRLNWVRNASTLNGNDSEDEQNQTSKFKQDIRGSTYLFSIDLNERYQLQQPKYAIYCGKNSIGFGKNDLRIFSSGNKHSKNYIKFPSSFNNGLYLPIKKSSLVLSGSYDSYGFRIPQWQIFEVILDKNKNLHNAQKRVNQSSKNLRNLI